MAILVFPSSLEASVHFADEARRWHQRVIGASSLDDDPYALHYDVWKKLPFISEGAFFAALKSMVEHESIASIYSPHVATFNLLRAELPSRLPGVALIGGGPFDTVMKRTKAALLDARLGGEAIERFGLGSAQLPLQFVAGLMLQMNYFHGECSREKALALCAVMPTAVKGDIVEIGVLFGKSAYVLNRLSSYLKLGTTLVIDPWNLELSIQHDASVNIQDTSRGWDWEIVHQGFLMNMLSTASPPFNYMRTASADAFGRYASSREVYSVEFGRTPLSGTISVLHIDGNHDEASVTNDFDLWSERLAPGAWIVFDDYSWPHGDGPRNAAGCAMAKLGSRLRRSFMAGGALFVQLAG